MRKAYRHGGEKYRLLGQVHPLCVCNNSKIEVGAESAPTFFSAESCKGAHGSCPSLISFIRQNEEPCSRSEAKRKRLPRQTLPFAKKVFRQAFLVLRNSPV